MIKEFQGEYRWLSNFAPVHIKLKEFDYPSVEHAYMSAKSDSYAWKLKCAGSYTAGQIKRLSKTLKLVDNWEQIKLTVMSNCLYAKFQQEPYRSKLIATGNQHIQEGNRWGDTFWGVDLRTGKGENNLGKLIMEIRKSLT